jgi:hypothetical protein
MAKTRRVNFILYEDTVNKLKKVAKHKPFRGNMTAALEEILELFFSWDPEFRVKMHKMADQMQLPVNVFMECIIIRKFATETAFVDVFGTESPDYLKEFRFQDGKLVRGDDLFNQLYHEAKQIFEHGKQKMDSGELPVKKTEDGKLFVEVPAN